MNVFKSMMLYTAVLFQFGCATHQMNLQTRLIEENAIPHITPSGSVQVLGVCEDKVKRICSQGAHRFEANHCTYVNIAKEVLKDALTRSGVAVKVDGQKSLTLSLDKAYCRSFIGTAVVQIGVKTGNGFAKQFEGRKTPIGSAFENTRNFELSIQEAVQLMVNDVEIVAYLEK